MERVIEDALLVQNYLPWLDNDEEIINFMRKIPLNNSYLRIPITIKYFINIRDSLSVLEEDIEAEANEIVTILPIIPVQEIKKLLRNLGTIDNRKEVVLRILLSNRNDIDKIIDQMLYTVENRKRSTVLQAEEIHHNKNSKKIRKISKEFETAPVSFYESVPDNKNNLQSTNTTPNQKNIIQPARFKFPDNSNGVQNTIAVETEHNEIIPQSTNTSEAKLETISEEENTKPLPDSTMPLSNHSTIIENGMKKSLLQNSTYVLPDSNNTSINVKSTLNSPIAGPSYKNLLDECSAHSNMIMELSDPPRVSLYPHKDQIISTSNHLPKAGPSHENIEEILIDLSKYDTTPPIPERKRNFDEKLVLRLIEMFPETCPNYIKDICDEKKWSDFDDLVTTILENEDHPKRQRRSPSPLGDLDPEEQLEMVKALLPDADPTFLRMKCDMLEYNPNELNKFIDEAREKKDYPTMKDYLRKEQLSVQSKQYTTDFSIEKFIELFPEPHVTFNDPKRVIELDNYSRYYIKQYFENKFNKLPKKVISQVILENDYKILKINNRLTLLKDSSVKMKTARKPTSLNSISNILVLQEFAYLNHKTEIEAFIKAKQEKEEEERKSAKENGLMNTCQCCFDDEVMPKDSFYCPKNCLFCRSCIKKSSEIAFSEGRTNFKCLNECSEEFTLQTLQTILKPNMFSKLAQKKMIEEIKAAGIEDLEMCPFCDFATIPNEADKIFKCLNPDCMKESCRNCKEPNHIPLHCDEIEKDENVKARVFIENKMTEALLCKCWKCGTSFFKEEGCNKMTCTCGAQMCYVCKKPVKDYKHFNGMGGDKYHLCPLYSDNNVLNKQKVLNAVKEAKSQIDVTKLKADPTDNIQQYFDNRRQKLPQEPHLEVLRNLVGRHHQLLLERQRQNNRGN